MLEKHADIVIIYLFYLLILGLNEKLFEHFMKKMSPMNLKYQG